MRIRLRWKKGVKRDRQKNGLKKIYKEIEVDIQEIKRDSGGLKRDKNRYKWIDEDSAEIMKMEMKDIGINLDWQRDIKI